MNAKTKTAKKFAAKMKVRKQNASVPRVQRHILQLADRRLEFHISDRAVEFFCSKPGYAGVKSEVSRWLRPIAAAYGFDGRLWKWIPKADRPGVTS
jgi:hypothetical protein